MRGGPLVRPPWLGEVGPKRSLEIFEKILRIPARPSLGGRVFFVSRRGQARPEG